MHKEIPGNNIKAKRVLSRVKTESIHTIGRLPQFIAGKINFSFLASL
jgi:hypothetical protein